jgi:cell division control protein 6
MMITNSIHMAGFTRTTSPFDSPHVLEEAYEPDDILGRDEELDAIHRVLQQIIDNDPTLNSFIYGPSGVGKTASVQYKLTQLTDSAAQYADIRIHLIWQNCDGHSTSYQVAISLANQLLAPSEQLPPSGLPKTTVYTKLFEALDNQGDTDESVTDHAVIVLDEVDNIGTSDRILYQIPRAQANDRLHKIKPTVIGISNDLTFKDNLSPKVVSSLCEREITFSRYDATDLHAILAHRVKHAFVDGAVDESVIRHCAAIGRKEGGDARYALDVLKNAGRNAKDESRIELSNDDVEQAYEDLERSRVRDALSDLSDHELMTVAAIVAMNGTNQIPARRGEIYTVYRRFAIEVLDEANVSRRMHEYLNELTMFGLLSRTEVKAGPGKNYFEYQLDSLSPSMAIGVLGDCSHPFDPERSLLPPSLVDQMS